MNFTQVIGLALIALALVNMYFQGSRLFAVRNDVKHYRKRAIDLLESNDRLYNENLKLRQILDHKGIKINF